MRPCTNNSRHPLGLAGCCISRAAAAPGQQNLSLIVDALTDILFSFFTKKKMYLDLFRKRSPDDVSNNMYRSASNKKKKEQNFLHGEITISFLKSSHKLGCPGSPVRPVHSTIVAEREARSALFRARSADCTVRAPNWLISL